MRSTPDGGWILNPEASFPLTIYGASKAEIKRIHSTLEAVKESGDDRPLRDLFFLFFQDRCYCKEIEDYIEASAPIYNQRFEEARNNCAEWGTAKKRRQNALLKEFHAEATRALDMHPGAVCRLENLFQEEFEDERAEAIVQVLSHTYTMASYAGQRVSQASDLAILPAVSGWEVFSVGDGNTCRLCAESPRRFPTQNQPQIPRHLGCRCSLTAVIGTDLGGPAAVSGVTVVRDRPGQSPCPACAAPISNGVAWCPHCQADLPPAWHTMPVDAVRHMLQPPPRINI